MMIIDSNSVKDKYGFTMMDNVVLMSVRLPNHSKVLYLHLKNFYFKVNQALDFGLHKTFYISREELGKLMQMSASSIDGYMKPLKEVGLIEIKSQGIGKPNVYLLKELTTEMVDMLQPDITKWKNSKIGSPDTVNDNEQPTETGSPYVANDHIEPYTPQNAAKDPAESCDQLKSNTFIKEKKSMQTLPSNIPAKKSLFDLPSNASNMDPLTMLKALKSKSKLTRKLQYIESGELGTEHLEVLDLCFYYAQMHKEIMGYEIPYQKEAYMSTFMDKYNLTIEETYHLVPKMLSTFRTMCEEDKRKKSLWYLKIGWFVFDAPSDIARLMDKVKPKVNEKYLEDEPAPTSNPGKRVDEVF